MERNGRPPPPGPCVKPLDKSAFWRVPRIVLAILDKSKLVFWASFWNTFWRDSRIVLVHLDKSKLIFKELWGFLVYFCVMKIRFLPDKTEMLFQKDIQRPLSTCPNEPILFGNLSKKVSQKDAQKISFDLSKMINTIRGTLQKSVPKRYTKDLFEQMLLGKLKSTTKDNS